MQLIDMNGNACGNIGDDQEVPKGYFTKPDDAPLELTALQFLEKIGPERFSVIWAAAIQNPAIAFQLVRALAAQSIFISESFPNLVAMEKAGLLPAGTALEVWK